HARIEREHGALSREERARVALPADHAPPPAPSLLDGRVEARGIARAYHGWLYDAEGNARQTPAEPADSKLYLTVKHRAYPVQQLLGLYWAYLGPEPVPPIRRLDIAAYPVEHIMEMTFEASWVQVVENNMDGTHIGILHQDTGIRNGSVRGTTRGM